MTESKIKEIRDEVRSILAVHLETENLKSVLMKLRPVFDYAIEKAETNDLLKMLQKSTGGSIIVETPKAHNKKAAEAQTAEKLLGEMQVYIAGFMDASNTIWNHLESCSESIRIQNGEKAF